MGLDAVKTQKTERVIWRVKLSREEANQEIRDAARIAIRNWVIAAAMLWVIWYPFREILSALSPRVSDGKAFWIILSLIASAWALLATGLLVWIYTSRHALSVTRGIDDQGILAGSQKVYAVYWSQVAAIREDRSEGGQLNRLALFGKDKTMSYLHLPDPVVPRILELVSARGIEDYDVRKHGTPVEDPPLANWVIISIVSVVMLIVLFAYLLREQIASQIEASRMSIGFWTGLLMLIAMPVISILGFFLAIDLTPRQRRSFAGWMLVAYLSLYILVPSVIWADRTRELLREMRSIDHDTRSRMENTIRVKSRTDP